jgi:ubiquinone/menaquinone biosynthesis C-methylase UbiE
MRPDETTVLDLGCGGKKHAGAFGVDVRDVPGVDLVHDLDSFPWPLPSNQYTEIYCQDIIEHIDKIEPFLRELARISAKGATIELRTPHFTSWYAYNDPTHRHYFGYFFLDHFVSRKNGTIVSSPLFAYRLRRLLFSRLFRLCGISAMANRAPARYEQLFCWIFPCENMLFQLAPLKE